MRRFVLGRCFALLVITGALASVGALEAANEPGLTLFTVVRWTLERDPNVAIEESRVDGAQGNLLAVRGAFDPVVASSLTASDLRTPESPTTDNQSRSVGATLGATQKLRFGMSLEPEIALDQISDPNGSEPAANQGTVTFRIRQPLLRGRGRLVTTVQEAAASLELAAARLDLEQRIAERLLAVVSQYWTWVAAERNLAVARESEESSRVLFETTRLLIEADQVPAAELVQLEANLASKESSTLSAEQASFAARQVLGREIGLEPTEIAALPLPTEPFPVLAPAEPSGAELPGAELPGAELPADSAGWVERARRRRADHRAAQVRREEAVIRRRAASSNLQPALDLVFAPSWTGLDLGSGTGHFLGPLGRNVPGTSATLGLSLSWPVGNREAEGALLQAEAAARQSELATALVSKAIGANVPAALDALAKSSLRLDKARQAERLFERAVSNEEKKLRAGTSTLLDLISQQDRLTAARQGVVSAELAVAQALAQLRFETGTLFAGRGEAAELQQSRLTTVPGEDEP